jgi:NAD+ diphosphatase
MLQNPSDFRGLVTATSGVNLDRELTYVFRGNELLVNDSGDAVAAMACEDPAALTIGEWRNRAIRAQQVAPGCDAPSGTRWAGLRSLFGTLPDDEVAVAGRALQVLEWDRTHRFCGACAAATVREPGERARRCPSCKLSAYPRISPAMMCLVTRGKEIMLARNVSFPPNRYSALAGFVEAGESVEDALHREVFEEVGIRVASPRYFASQSWPFPNSLMIAYTAEYESGALTPNGIEIAEAGWFTKDNLPQLPPRVSIARALIEDTLHRLT